MSGLRWFAALRVKSWRAGVLETLRHPVKLATIVVAWTVLLGGIYALALQGLRFLYDTAGLGPFLLSRLWFLFLFVILVMLAVSQMTSAYSTLVRAPETRFWMTLPVSARTLCRMKWLESSFYSAWAVVLLALPLCLAYLRVLQRPWWIVGGVAGALFIPFMGSVTAVATMALFVWLRWFGRLVIRREMIPLGFVAACTTLFWVLGEQHQSDPSQDVWFLALQELLPRMRIAMAPWWPSRWVATAMDALVNERWREAGLYALLLWTTMGVAWRILDHLGARLLFPILRTHAHPVLESAPEVGTQTLVRWSAAWWMRGPLQASLAKDILLVVRDPMQWTQAVVFFGLLGAYFANIHRLTQFGINPSWRVGVVSLNLACTLLVFGALAVRFLFPQMSLEGRSLWLLRIAPHGMRHLLFSKLYLYGAIAVVIVEGLLAMSVTRLAIPGLLRWWLAGVGVVSALTLVALTAGLGACWIDPTAQDAARVVSSSNGALVLVFMIGYIGCVVAALVTVWKSWGSGSWAGMWLASLGLAAASAVMGGLPMRRGLARLERLENAV